MSSDNRTPEMKDKPKQSARELLSESARLVTGFFHRGFCTVCAAAERWKQFVGELSLAADNLKKPLFWDGMEPPAHSQSAVGQPMVTVVNSQDPEQFPIGERMTLADTERRIKSRDIFLHGKEPDVGRCLELRIDYMMDGKPDRYWASPSVGLGQGSLLTQIQNTVAGYQQDLHNGMDLFGAVPPEFRTTLEKHFSPLLEQGLDSVSVRLLSCFQRHCDISRMEQRFQDKAETLPESARKQYLTAARETIHSLRQEANGLLAAPPVREAQAGPGNAAVPRQPRGKVRASVKITLRAIREGSGTQPAQSRPPRPRER